ncbi:MAG TPA: MBL fold metallo-hydrolase [Steroidobacteraceae bacterium]|nr:MBL fold metallo-hydrolase [Steroidobacteraceae bacterium]
MRVRFWGTRGSIAKSGPHVRRYGGNTSCVEVRTDAGTLIVLDCGTGAHDLGRELTVPKRAPQSGYLLLSHMHWDHIQGLPFFAPLLSPETRWDIYAPRGIKQSLQQTLAGQMQSPYFPVTLEELGADIRYHELVEGELQIDDVHVTTQYLNHPALTLGYRLRADGTTLVYTSDHEPHARELAAGHGQVSRQDLRHVRFLRDADLVIHDAQFTPEEYQQRAGWGHSTGQYAVQMCQMAGARALALTHHDPGRHDNEVDQIVRAVQATLGEASALDVFAAADGHVLTLARSSKPSPSPAPDAVLAVQEPTALLRQSVVIGAADMTLAGLLLEAVRADGFRVTLRRNAREAVEAVEADRPSLVVIEHTPGTIDGVAACQDIRRLAIAETDDLPVIVVSAQESAAGDVERGVTERISPPFSAAYLQTRVQAWMLRQACRWQSAKLLANEEQRLAALHELGVLDTPAEERFDRLTRLAAALFEVPVALITLVDRDRQWFKSRHGFDLVETPRDMSFCAHALFCDKVMVVSDTRIDDRFADNPLVARGPRFRFYAGYPIKDAGGICFGTLCLLDMRPRNFDEAKLELLRDLGDLVRRELCGC